MTLNLMSPPVTVREDAYVTHVRQLMRDGYRSLPVVDGQSRVKGMVILPDVIKVTSTKSPAKPASAPPWDGTEGFF